MGNCPMCYGTGLIERSQPGRPNDESTQWTCHACKGSGRTGGKPPELRSLYDYCAAKDDCDCGLPKVCLTKNHGCDRMSACDGKDSCRCGAKIKVCTDPDCKCGRPKAHL